MSCPTCDHTMQRLNCGCETSRRWFWCPRCGTVKQDESDADAPALVDRCRKMQALNVGLTFRVDWKRLGIAESINLPKNRPTE